LINPLARAQRHDLRHASPKMLDTRLKRHRVSPEQPTHEKTLPELSSVPKANSDQLEKRKDKNNEYKNEYNDR
jgi:hypothetical protein